MVTTPTADGSSSQAIARAARVMLVALAVEACRRGARPHAFRPIPHQNDLFVARVGAGSNFALKDLIVRPLREA